VIPVLGTTETAVVLTDKPAPTPKFKVTSPVVPPPVKPLPATTDSMSPASFVKLNCPVPLS
jgi:hypothetical protein